MRAPRWLIIGKPYRQEGAPPDTVTVDVRIARFYWAYPGFWRALWRWRK